MRWETVFSYKFSVRWNHPLLSCLYFLATNLSLAVTNRGITFFSVWKIFRHKKDSNLTWPFLSKVICSESGLNVELPIRSIILTLSMSLFATLPYRIKDYFFIYKMCFIYRVRGPFCGGTILWYVVLYQNIYQFIL